MDLAPALVHSRGRVTPGVAGQAARSLVLSALSGFSPGDTWALLGAGPAARHAARCWVRWFLQAASDGRSPADDFFAHGDVVASAIEDLPVDDVAREDPSSGAFEVALGALHFDGNDTNAFAVGRRVPRAREGDVELPVAEYRTGKEEAGALKRLALGLVDGHGEGDAQWELAPSEREGKAGIGRLEGNTGNGDFEADELAGDDDALEEVRVNGGDDKAGTVSEAGSRI